MNLRTVGTSVYRIISMLGFGFSAQAIDLPVVVDPITPLTGTYAVEWNATGNFENWTTSQVTSASVAGGNLTGVTSSSAPQIICSNFAGPDLDLGFNDYLELRMQVPATHTGDIKISYGTTARTGFSTARVLVIPDALVPTDGAFHTYRIDVGPEPWWRANLRDLRIEPSATSGQSFAIDYLRVGDLPGDVYLANTEWNSDNEMSSKHFRFIWNAARAAQGVNAATARGALRNAEEAWQVYVKVMGYREPAESTSSPNGNKYKVNFLCIYDGYWMSSTGGGFGYMNIEPSGLQVDPPSWIIPHELMHVFQHHNNNGHYSGQWETHANYGRERWLQHYQDFYPNRSNIEALAVRDGHFMISSGRNYYLTWPFLYYIDDNPDNLPDLADGMIKRLWQEGQPGEFWTATLDRLTPTTSLKDLSGYYARRCATWDFSNQSAMTAELNAQDPARTARHTITDLIQRSDAPTWWRVAPNKAPAQGAYAIHELIPTGTGAGRVVTVNLQGLSDSARGADWRASFVAVSDTGVERYTPLWSNGSSSITLAANENKLYLSVAGTPDWYANGGYDEAAEPFRSHPSRSRFHYQVQVTGATPRERNNGASTGLIQHSNGGGYRSVAVPASVYIGPNARVTGGSVSGNARIEDFAVVTGGTVNSNAVISGHAWVRGGTVTDFARVRDWAIIDSGTISGNARVLENATVEGNMQDLAVAKGSAWHQNGGTLSGNAIVDGDYMGNKSFSNGIAFGHMPFVGIPDNFITATPTGHFVSYDFSNAHESRALDRFGVTDSFTIGSPTWTSTDWKRKGFLTFNGSNQYIALDRSVNDMRAFTFAAWIKPASATANQAVVWLGESSTKRLYFTPNDGSGLAKFSIINGGAEQTLTSSALPVGVWSHVAITLDGTTGTLLINGNIAASGSVTMTTDQLLAPNTTTGRQHNYLARAEGSLMPMFQGSLDDVQFFSSALTPAQLAAATVPLAGDLMLSDNFNSPSYGASTFNSTLAADQQGLLAPTTYRVAGHNADYKIQHGNGGQLLMAGWLSGESLDLYASLNQNFAEQANGLNKPLKIEFDLRITDSSNSSNWAALAIGNAQNLFVNQSGNKFSSLFRHNGGTQQFASGSDISNGSTWNAAGSTITVILSDAAGNASAFNGNGSLAQMYINGSLVGSYPLAQLSATDGFFSLEGCGVFCYFDNLSISVVRSSDLAVTYQGNGNTGGSAPVDLASPYAENATVTVLGNTGALVKTGSSFSHWNTAADGSGISYQPGESFLITAPTTLYAQWTLGPDFFWDNSASTNTWSTSDANWRGVSWVNSSSHHAWFQSTGGSIALTSGLTAGNLYVGNNSTNFPAISFSGGSLNLANLIVQGNANNDGTYASNPTATISSTVVVSGDTMIGRSNLTISGGSYRTDRFISNSASADWANLTISNGTVTATNGIDGSVNTGATFALNLNGGTLYTPSIKVADREAGVSNNAWLTFNGTTVKATADHASFITLYGGNQNAYISNGGAIINTFDDTTARNITIGINLRDTTGHNGSLTKQGFGTLTLSASNTYTGSTTVSQGVLSVTGSILSTSSITIASGAELRSSGTLQTSGNVVNSGTLVFTGTAVFSAGGTITNYGTIINSSPTLVLPANIINLGSIVTLPSAPTGLAATANGSSAALSWTAVAGATSYRVKQSNSVNGPFTVVGSPTSNSFSVNGLAVGTYSFVVSAVNAAGESAHSSVVSCTIGALPAPWVTADIGTVGLAGSATALNGIFTVRGSGTGVYASTDQFRMVYQNSSGDCDMIARVDSLTNSSVSAKVGVMIRESLAANARCAAVYVTPTAGVQFIWRTSTGSMVNIATVSGRTAPQWVRMQRVGNSFRAFYSTNGSTWTQFGGSKTISMSTNAIMGQAVTSGTNASLCTGVFSGISATP